MLGNWKTSNSRKSLPTTGSAEAKEGIAFPNLKGKRSCGKEAVGEQRFSLGEPPPQTYTN